MSKAVIVPAPKNDRGYFSTVTTNTGLSQRDSLEEIMVNLATVLGIQKIFKQESARGSFFYEPQGVGRSYVFQSATNTILELSRNIAKK